MWAKLHFFFFCKNIWASKSPMVSTWVEARKGQTTMGKTKVDTNHKIMFIFKSYSATISFLFYRPTTQRSLPSGAYCTQKRVSSFFNDQALVWLAVCYTVSQSRSANAFTGLLGKQKVIFAKYQATTKSTSVEELPVEILDLAIWHELSGINSALFELSLSPK